MIKWNTLVIFHIETHTEWYILKQISVKIIGNIFYSCSKCLILSNAGGCVRLSGTGVVGGEVSLPNSSSSRTGFPVKPPISKLPKAVEGKGLSLLGLKTASTYNWSFSQHKAISSRSKTWYPFVSLFGSPFLRALRPSFHVFLAG